jgi:hypothetical protein
MIHELSHELFSSSLRVAYCTLPHEWSLESFLVGFKTTDVNLTSDRANTTNTYSSIHIDFEYCVRPTVGCLVLVLVLGTLAQHDLDIDMIGI